MTEFLLIVLAVIGIILIYVLVDCAKSLRESRKIHQDISNTLQRELGRQSLVLEAGISARRLEGMTTFRLEQARLQPNRLAAFRFSARVKSHSVAGYAIWVFRDGCWRLEENLCHHGFEPGPPPDITGRFPGDRIRKEGIPISAR